MLVAFFLFYPFLGLLEDSKKECDRILIEMWQNIYIFSVSFKVIVIYLFLVKVLDTKWMAEQIILSAIKFYIESKQQVL